MPVAQLSLPADMQPTLAFRHLITPANDILRRGTRQQRHDRGFEQHLSLWHLFPAPSLGALLSFSCPAGHILQKHSLKGIFVTNE